ncbi:MAG: hypothetical protein U1E39_15115 [Planctomycetota bacterium]
MKGFRAYVIYGGLLVATYLGGGLAGWWKSVSFQGWNLGRGSGGSGYGGGGFGGGGGFRGGK